VTPAAAGRAFVILGDMEPGSLQGVQITTSDLEAVRKELVERGVGTVAQGSGCSALFALD
jgi:hypothetical protein